MYDDVLPFTGAGITVGGLAFGLPTVLAIAAGLVIAGIGVYRMVTRSRRARP
jgi:hypothetical protein